tara:strand:+ start:1742 stop:1891 length:150 start_codon:yes stop_codon:yes gene_type:complete
VEKRTGESDTFVEEGMVALEQEIALCILRVARLPFHAWFSRALVTESLP